MADMKSRLHDVPILREIPTTLRANHYNTVRLALLRLGRPLRVELEGLRHLDMLLDDDAWICVDRTLNDVPVMAWTDFQHGRLGLTDPVACRLRFYHAHAGIIINTALETVDRVLSGHLASENAGGPHDVKVLVPRSERPAR